MIYDSLYFIIVRWANRAKLLNFIFTKKIWLTSCWVSIKSSASAKGNAIDSKNLIELDIFCHYITIKSEICGKTFWHYPKVHTKHLKRNAFHAVYAFYLKMFLVWLAALYLFILFSNKIIIIIYKRNNNKNNTKIKII